MSESVKMVDLSYKYNELEPEYKKVATDVFDTKQFIGGKENKYVKQLELSLGDYLDNQVTAVACNSGTTALLASLVACGVGEGDRVLVPDFNFIAAPECIKILGAIPIFVDVCYDSMLIDVDLIKETSLMCSVKAIVITDLFGQFINYADLDVWAYTHNIKIIEDAAQSFGAEDRDDNKACTFGDIAITSFYPAKPLYGFGEGGAVFTNDVDLLDKVRAFINHGELLQKYNTTHLGFNGRISPITAGTVSINLREMLGEALSKRRYIAEKYDIVVPPEYRQQMRVSFPTYAQYTLKVPDRKLLVDMLNSENIDSAIHYPKPNSDIYSGYTLFNGVRGVASKLCDAVVSVPIHPGLSISDIYSVTCVLCKYFEVLK